MRGRLLAPPFLTMSLARQGRGALHMARSQLLLQSKRSPGGGDSQHTSGVCRDQSLTDSRQYATDAVERRGADETKKLEMALEAEEDQVEESREEEKGSEENVMEWQERMERRFGYDDITRQLYTLFDALHAFHQQQQAEVQRDATTAEMMLNQFGFALTKRRSTIPNAGHGLFLEGFVNAGTCVCIYPGAVYQPGDPLLLPSLRNDYLIRRSDGSSVDGRPRGLSRYFYRSIYEKFGPFAGLCDATWLDVEEGSTNGHNPIGWGHLINHSDTPNVMYFEYQFPADTPAHYLPFIPNVYYSSKDPAYAVKSVVLMAMRRIRDEELFSNYNFIGRPTPASSTRTTSSTSRSTEPRV